MNTLFGNTPSPSPEEIQAYMRRAHIERAHAVRAMFAALFHGRRDRADGPHAAGVALRPAA
jgi:hypothetical protein